MKVLTNIQCTKANLMLVEANVPKITYLLLSVLSRVSTPTAQPHETKLGLLNTEYGRVCVSIFGFRLLLSVKLPREWTNHLS